MTEGLNRKALVIMVAAAAILMITMGMRQSLGLFIAPIIDSTHVGYAAMSFAMAVGQLHVGRGATDLRRARRSLRRRTDVLLVGALMMAVGSALTPFATNEFALIVTIGMLTAAGAGAGSFGVLIGVVAQSRAGSQALGRVRLRQRRRQPGPVRVRAAQPAADLQHHLDGRDVEHGGRGAGHRCRSRDC